MPVKEKTAADEDNRKKHHTIEYDYPTFHLSMQCFWCQIVEGTPVLKEHEAARWLDPESFDSVDWLPADLTIIPTIAAALENPVQ